MEQILMEMVPKNIVDLAAEATAEHNDGYVKEQATKTLRAIKDYIEEVLPKNPL